MGQRGRSGDSRVPGELLELLAGARERETDRERERQTDRERGRNTQRDTSRET